MMNTKNTNNTTTNGNNGKVTIDDLAVMIKIGFDEVHEKMSGLVTKEEFNKTINKMKNEMVTKDFLTEKLADLRGDLNLIIRGEDGKVMKLVDILHEKRVLTAEDVKQMWSMRPFPRTI